MKARAFFYVCAAIMCLAVAYHLGARSAVAQSGSFRVLGFPKAAVVNETIYLWDGNSQRWMTPSSAPPVPASSLIAGDGGTYIASDGTLWYTPQPNSWAGVPLPANPTHATPQTMGQLKARYR